MPDGGLVTETGATIDARVADSGVDASDEDGGTEDIGTDAGAVDAGIKDAGVQLCRRTCSTLADCTTPNISSLDDDNWTCDRMICEYLGCNNDCGAGQICVADTSGINTCQRSCSVVADCTFAGSTLFDEDNWSCSGGACLYLGCNGDAECIDGNGAGFVCRNVGGQDSCVRSCTMPSDCAASTRPAEDEDNWGCTAGICEYLGCNDSQECIDSFMSADFVCE